MAPDAQATLRPAAPAEPDPPLPAETVIDGRYRVVRLIGEGGMGRVYEAEHLFIRRRMALKLVRRDAGTGEGAARVLQEAMLAGKVPHATVVPVFDCAALPDGQVYVAMELLRGESLEQALSRPQPAAVVLGWIAEVARGLAAAHRAGIVHRDVKPANVFLARTAEGAVQPRLLDFGIAKLLPGMADGAAESVQTQAGALLGTPHYMAPERVRGEPGGPSSDLYGVGVMLYEAMTGALPFVGDSFMAIVGRHLREPPLDPRQAAPARALPDALAALILALLDKDPGARPGDGEAVAAGLGEIVAREPGLADLQVGAPVAGAPAGAATRRLEDGLADRSGAATRRLEDGLADRSGAATRRLEDGLADRSGAARTVDVPADRSGGRGRLWLTLALAGAAGVAGASALRRGRSAGAPPGTGESAAESAAVVGPVEVRPAEVRPVPGGEIAAVAAERPAGPPPAPPETTPKPREPEKRGLERAAVRSGGLKSGRKVGTTEPKPPGPGPKIKTDVYDE